MNRVKRLFTSKYLLVLLGCLLITMSAFWVLSPRIDVKVNPGSQDAVDFVKPKETIPDDDIPEHYIKLIGYSNIYKNISDPEKISYFERTDENEFIPYDINKPDNYRTLEDAASGVYAVYSANGAIVEYRKFNGENWNVVDKAGTLVFTIPSTYIKLADKDDIYYLVVDGKKAYKQLVKFQDGSYGWKNISGEEFEAAP